MWHIQSGSLSKVHIIEGLHDLLPCEDLADDYGLNMTRHSLCINDILVGNNP